MEYFPIELEDYVIDYIYYKKCYLENDDYVNLRRCREVSKNFNYKFKCKPKLININNSYLELCCLHDKLLIQNIKKIFNKVFDNFDDIIDYYVIIDLNDDEDIMLPLSVFNLEPYINIMEDNYNDHYLNNYNAEDLPQVKKINRVIKKMFEILAIKYNDLNITTSFGLNSQRLRNKNQIVNNFISKYLII